MRLSNCTCTYIFFFISHPSASVPDGTSLLVKFPVQQLNKETKAGIVQEKLAVYQHANKEVEMKFTTSQWSYFLIKPSIINLLDLSFWM